MKAKHFKIHELVDKETYEKYGQKAWQFIDDRLIEFLDRLRTDLESPITVNNWYWGGDREWSGLRTAKSPYYSPYSQHTFGRAADFLVQGMNSQKARAYILKYRNHYPEVKGVELDVSWVHTDVRNVDQLLLFRP